MEILSKDTLMLLREERVRDAIDALLRDARVPAITITLDDAQQITVRRVGAREGKR